MSLPSDSQDIILTDVSLGDIKIFFPFLLMAYILQTRSEEIIFAGPNQYPSELAQNQIGDET